MLNPPRSVNPQVFARRLFEKHVARPPAGVVAPNALQTQHIATKTLASPRETLHAVQLRRLDRLWELDIVLSPVFRRWAEVLDSQFLRRGRQPDEVPLLKDPR